MKMRCGFCRQNEAAMALFCGEHPIQKRRRASLVGAVQTAKLRASMILGLFLCIGSIVLAVPPIRIDDPVEGQKLASELRATAPIEDSQFTGVLRIFSPGAELRQVPVRNAITVGNKVWESRYEARPANLPKESLSITRSPGASTNYYQWQHGDKMEKPTGNAATNSFAGSDFTLLDLGLEFFNWPTQMLVTKEMRKGRGCQVLESRPAEVTLYSRVLTWIDEETNGILMAEAYDAHGKLLKEFEVSGFAKVNGRYQVSEMEIRNRQTKTRTRLVFEFDEH